MRKDIKGYEGLYAADGETGEIIMLSKSVLKGRSCVHIMTKERAKKPHKTPQGYLLISLTKDKKSKTYSVHRLIAETLLPNPKNLPQVNHKDGNRSNNKLKNLEWVTQSENMLHSYHVLKYSPSELTREKRRKKMTGRQPHINNVLALHNVILNLNTGVFHYSIKETMNAYCLTKEVVIDFIGKNSFLKLIS